LDAAASSLGLELKVTKDFTRESGEGIAQFEEVRQLAFSDEVLIQAENSAVIEVANGSAIAIHLKEHKPSIIKPLDQVADEILSVLETEKARSLIAKKKDEILAMLSEGESANTVAEKANKEWQVKTGVTRGANKVPPEILKEAFKMARPTEGEKSISYVELGDADVSIITLTKVHDNIETIDTNELNGLVQRNSRLSANNDWIRHVANLKENADINYRKAEVE